MRNYSNNITNQPQTKPIFGRTDMVENNAGGFSFKISEQEQLERFLLLGSENGTYYVSEQKLTEENAQSIVAYIKTNPVKVIQTVIDFATNNRAPRADAGLFVLALVINYGNDEARKIAYDSIRSVCKTSTQLFTFLANMKNLPKGWSRGLRKGVSRFYSSRDASQIAYQMVKYRNRSSFTHKDVLRLSHASSTVPEINSLFGYAVGKVKAEETNNPLIETFEVAQTATVDALVVLIQEMNLTWEMVPTDKLNDPKVLNALLVKMPLHALIRNLNRFSYNGMTKGNTGTVKTITARLTNEELVKKAGVHPVMVVNAMLTYSSGRGQLGGKTWEVNQNIVDALGTTYELALKAIVPTGKDILIGVDVSGSMNSSVSGTAMSAAQLSSVLALTLLKSEPNAEVVFFDTNAYPSDFGRRSSVDEVINKRRGGGGTDCAIPFIVATSAKKKFDAIIILTDNETWAGTQHGLPVLEQYRKTINSNVKVIEVALVSNPYTNLPVDDKNVLRVVGFDSSVLNLVNKYLE